MELNWSEESESDAGGGLRQEDDSIFGLYVVRGRDTETEVQQDLWRERERITTPCRANNTCLNLERKKEREREKLCDFGSAVFPPFQGKNVVLKTSLLFSEACFLVQPVLLYERRAQLKRPGCPLSSL